MGDEGFHRQVELGFINIDGPIKVNTSVFGFFRNEHLMCCHPLGECDVVHDASVDDIGEAFTHILLYVGPGWLCWLAVTFETLHAPGSILVWTEV